MPETDPKKLEKNRVIALLGIAGIFILFVIAVFMGWIDLSAQMVVN